MNAPKSVKTIDPSLKEWSNPYRTKHPTETHTKEEMDALHYAIRYTHVVKQAESLSKMDEEELIARPLPIL